MKSGFVAIVGQPNVGKSTLLNRFIGEPLAIVTPKPQTTRQNIKGVLNRSDAQAVFLDTPGFHESNKPLNKLMIEKVGEAIESADVAVLVVEPRERPSEMDMAIFNKMNARPDLKKIVVINKIDAALAEPYGVIVERYWKAFGETPTMAISAKNGEWCDDLLKKIIELLPEHEPYYPLDEFTEHSVRFLASEIVREQAMLLLKQELPYSLAVDIEDFKEGPTTRIRATIIVEKDSQKGIVIGAKGQMIKQIGTLAREKIEALVGGKVFLELLVKVEKDWTYDEKKLERMLK